MATSASAAPPNPIEQRYTREYHQCMDNTGDVDSATADCLNSEIERQDARLNQAYVMVMRGLAPAPKAALRDSERTWVRQRDLQCKRQAADELGGTLYGVMLAGCQLDETIKRTMFLERYPR